MKRTLAILLAFVLLTSHDMYLKLDTYFLAPSTDASIKLYNGTFDKSENVIDRNRMIDVSLVGNGSRTRLDTTQWSEKDKATVLRFATGEPGTKVVGVSTFARNIEMEAEAFNKYLEHDGVVDMLKKRKDEGTLNEKAVEKYAKHVKAIFQVGETLTDDWKAELGYPIEFVPLANPYALAKGDQLKVKLLWQGKPLANQLVLANFAETTHEHAGEHKHEHAGEGNHEHGHDHAGDHDHDHSAKTEHEHKHDADHEHADKHDHAEGDHQHEHATEPAAAAADHTHDEGEALRTDQDGVLTLDLATTGIGYLRTIYMTLSEEKGLTHESNWATLTFEVGHGHAHDHANGAHTHDDGTSHTHDHEEEAGFPSFLFYGGSLMLLLGLFFWFNRKK